MKNAEIKNEELKAFDCCNCGAGLKHKLGTTTLICEYCKTINNIPEEEIVIEENDFEEYLEKLESENLVNEKTLQCKSCGAASIVNVNAKSSNCPYCGTSLTEGTVKEDRAIKPSYLLPFEIGKEKASQLALDWAKEIWYTKKIQSSSINLTGVYVPFWTFDTNTNSNYILENIQISGNNIFKQSISGQVSIFFDDLLIPATGNINNFLLTKIGPWDIKKLLNSNTEYLSDYTIEKYKTGLKQGFYAAKDTIDYSIRKNIISKADNNKIKSLQTQYSDIKFKHILLPVYVISYDYKGNKNQLYINGYTGRIAGLRPKNPVIAFFIIVAKVIFIILFSLMIFSIILALFF
jgi:hypothetical protein